MHGVQPRETSGGADDAGTRVTAHGWYVLGLLTAVYALSQIDRKVVAIVAEPIKREFGLSDGQLGALTGVMFGVPNALLLLPFGLLVDRVNRRTLIAGMLGVWSAACAATAFATSYVHLLVTRAAVGAAEAGGTSSSLSIIADIFPPRLRPMATALFQSAMPLGTVVCFTAVAWIGGEYGWRAAFAAAGVPGVLVGLLMMLTMREPVRGAADGRARTRAPAERATLKDGFAFLLRERAALHYVIGPGLVSAGSTGLVLWSPPFLMRLHGMSVGEAGLLLAIASGVVTAASLAVAGPLAARFAKGDPVRLALLPIATVLLSVAAAAVFLLSPGTGGVIAGLCLFGALNWQYLSLGYTLLLGLAPVHMRGTVLSIELIAANLLGYAGGPLIVGLLSDATGGAESLRTAMLMVLVLYVWGAGHLWLGRRQLMRRAA